MTHTFEWLGWAWVEMPRVTLNWHWHDIEKHWDWKTNLWVSVMSVSQVEVPRVTLPGTALGSSQKLTMLMNTWGWFCGSKLTGFHNLIDEVYQEAGGHIVANEVVAKVAFHQEIKHQGAVVPVWAKNQRWFIFLPRRLEIYRKPKLFERNRLGLDQTANLLAPILQMYSSQEIISGLWANHHIHNDIRGTRRQTENFLIWFDWWSI